MTTDNLLTSEMGAGRARGRRNIWIGVAVALVLFRLMMTADRDVVALNAPYDEYWFVHNAARMVWGGDYNLMAFAHLPIYSIWLSLLNLLGIPARLGIDMAWMASTAYAGYALARFSGRAWVGAVFWVFCVFHPILLVLFDRALSETLLVVLVALMLGAGLEIWNTRDGIPSRRGCIATALFAVSFAMAFHIRKEGSLFLLPVGLLMLLSFSQRKKWWPSLSGATLGMRLLVWPLLATALVGAVLVGLNYARWGLAVRYELAAPGYVRALTALSRIDAGPGPLHVTVSRRSRQLAYEFSPTFRELQGFFEGESGRTLAAHSARFIGHEGEIGNGWFYWALRDAGAMAGWHRNARYADQKYAAIADELQAAFDKGQLRAYPSWIPSLVDPDYHKWIRHVPSSTWTILSLLFETNPDWVRPPDENATPKQMAEFIEIAGRRNPLPSVSVRGWVVLPVGSSLGIAPAGSEPSDWAVLAPPQRADVPGAYSFHLGMSTAGADLRLIVKTMDGKSTDVSLSRLREGVMIQTEGAPYATLGVDELIYGQTATQFERGLLWLTGRSVASDWVHELGKVYWGLNVMFRLALLGVLLYWAVTRRVNVPALVFCGLAAVMVLSRATLLGVLDASSWDGVQVRYMVPLVPVFAFAALLGVSSVIRPRR